MAIRTLTMLAGGLPMMMLTACGGDHVESLVYYFPMMEGKETELRLHWGETVVPMLITVP